MNLPHSPLGDAASFLFVPATQPERYGKALTSGAHGVIIDLEDAVGHDDKPKARELLKNHWSSLSVDDKKRIVIRCNSPGTSFYAADLVLLRELQAKYLMIPKNPDMVIMDTSVIAKAPVRLLVSGMGDALSTYFEARANMTSG